MKHIFAFLLLAAGFLSHSAMAQQQIVLCNTTTGAACNTSSNPGDGLQGDPSWLSFGKTNANFSQIFSMLGNTGSLPAPVYGIEFNNNGTIAGLLPSGTGTWCLSWSSLSASPALVSCGSGSGTVTSVGLTVPSWLSVSGSPITSSGTLAIAGTTEPNNEVLASAPSGSQTALAPRALVAADIPAIPLASGVSGTLSLTNGGTGGTTSTAALTNLLPSQGGQSGNCLGTNGSVAGWIACGSGGSSAFNALTGGTNTTAAMVVGTGASLTPSGSGTITANTLSSGIALGTPASGTLTNLTGLPLTSGVTGVLPVANGGNGTASPSLVGGTNVTITGSWPNQTITASATGATAFSALTSSTNTQAAMLVGTGASLGATGSGSITATNTIDVNGATVPTSASVLGSNSSGQLVSETTTGTGNNVLATSPTLVTPNLGTPSALVLTNATGLPNASVIGLGTFATQNYASPPAIGGTTPAAGSFSSLTDTGITGSTQCLHVNSSGLLSGTGSDCGAGGSTTFSALTGSTNTSAAMLVGTGASLGPTGSGTVIANSVVSGTALGTPASLTLTNATGLPLPTGVTGILPIANGGTATSSPSLIAGTNVTITGTWPNQTVTASNTGATAFSALTGATNTSAAMVVGSGSSLATSGSGTIAATSLGALSGLPTIANQTVLGNGAGSTAVPVALTLTGNLVATSTGLGTSQPINAQTGTTYAMQTSDAGKLVTFNNASAVAVSLSVASTTGFTAGYSFDAENLGAGTVTITPTTSTINGGASLTIPTNNGCTVTSDGVNYQVSACTAVDTTLFSQMLSGTNTSAAMLVGSGASLATTGTGTISANQLNGTSLAGLATGLLKNTTSTGVPSIATSSDIIADFSGTCSSSTFLRGDGSCQTPSGSGNVSTSGTPTAHQTGVWVTSTTLEGVGPGTSGQAFVSGGASADPAFSSTLSGVTSVNGTTIAASAGTAAGSTGTFTANDCLKVGSTSPLEIQDAGAACGSGGGSGTVASSTIGQIPVYTGATTVTGGTNFTISTGALTLGASGTLGSVTMGNGTSGTVTLAPITGTLGTVTASLPANTGILAELNYAQTWTAAQTFTNSDLFLKGSSTGTNTFTAANASATNYTTTFPANTGTLAELNLAETWSAAQTFTNSDLLLLGSSTGATTFTSANASATNYTVTVPAATDTLAELAATQTLTNKTISGSSNTLSNVALSSLATQGANTVVMNATGSSAAPTAVSTVSYLIDAGTTFTLGTGTGTCATSSTLTGGSAVGSFKCTGTGGASTQIVNLPTTTNAWVCDFHDMTTTSDTVILSAASATSATASGTIAANDVIAFKCAGY